MTRTYAVGESNAVVRLDDHGITNPLWIDLTPLGDGDTIWRDVMSDPTDPDKVIIVGTSSSGGSNVGIQVSSDAGVTWATPTGNWAATADTFHELWYVDTMNIWAVSSSGYVARSTDGGATFDLTTTSVFRDAPEDFVATTAIHAISATVAVVLGSKSFSLAEASTYVWRTTDAGANWTILNSGAQLPNNLINPLTGLGYGYSGVAQGIWMSIDDGLTKIVAACGYSQQLSTDDGASFTSIPIETQRSGNHLTWFPSHDAAPQYFRHTGGTTVSVVSSSDSGLSYDNVRSYNPGTGNLGIVPPTNTPISILGAHFYEPFKGYYGYVSAGVSYIESTIDGGATGTNSHTATLGGQTYEAIWTSVEVPPFGTCFELTDCAGIATPIFTQTDLSAEVGMIITLADETNHEIEGCWTVSATTTSCPESDPVAVYKCYIDCVSCLPAEDPILQPCPRPVNPGYSLDICDPTIVAEAFSSFGEMMYQRMISSRYAVKYCCPPNEDALTIQHEKIKMNLRESINPTPDPCNPICYSYEINIDAVDSAVTTYVDCFEEEQTIVTAVDADPLTLPRLIGFCALDSTPPSTVVTHPDLSTDTYVLENLGSCTPPWAPAISCTGYNVTMTNNTSFDLIFRYTDCDGVEVIITKAKKTGTSFYNFCGLEGQTIVLEGTPHVSDIFIVSTGACGFRVCSEYTITLNSGVGGTFNFIDCDGVITAITYLAQFSDQVFVLCGLSNQTLGGGSYNFFDYVEGDDC